MSKTVLGPVNENVLKKIFPECLTGANASIEFGIVKLGSGEAAIVLSRSYNKMNVQLTAINLTAANRYSVQDRKNNNKFTIKSSDANDTSEVYWFVIGI